VSEDFYVLFLLELHFREGSECVLGAGTGALIVVGYDESVYEVIDGGFLY